MKASVLLLLWCVLCLSGKCQATKDSHLREKELPVCVLGAGAGGMSAAVFLKDNGYKVKVLEKSDRVGGHCETLTFAGGWYDLGVRAYQNTSFLKQKGFGDWSLRSDQFAQRFVPPGYLIPSTTDFGGLPSYGARFADGFDYGVLPAFTPTAEYYVAFTTLASIVSRYPWLEDKNYPTTIPPELLVPFDEFIVANGLQPLVTNVFNFFLFNGALANYSKVLTFYALQTVNLGILSYFTDNGSSFSVYNGCQQVYKGMREYVGENNIVLNAQLTRVKRSSKHVTVQYKVSGNKRGRWEEKCSKVVVAFNPTLSNLAPLKRLSPQEQHLFTGVESRVYVVFNVSFSGPFASKAGTLFNLNRTNTNPVNATYPNLPAITFFSKPFASVNTAHGYYYSDTVPNSDQDFLLPIRAQLASMPASVMSHVTLGLYYYHKYQVHFCEQLLRASVSPYTLLKQMQGQNNTFYVGAISSFPNSADIWNDNFELINQHFPKKN